MFHSVYKNLINYHKMSNQLYRNVNKQTSLLQSFFFQMIYMK